MAAIATTSTSTTPTKAEVAALSSQIEIQSVVSPRLWNIQTMEVIRVLVMIHDRKDSRQVSNKGTPQYFNGYDYENVNM